MNEAWTRDINQLESLATTEMMNVHEDLGNSAELLRRLSVDPIAFGELAASYQVAQTYALVRAQFERALEQSSQRVEAAAVAVATIAKHYRMIDEHHA